MLLLAHNELRIGVLCCDEFEVVIWERSELFNSQDSDIVAFQLGSSVENIIEHLACAENHFLAFLCGFNSLM